MTKQKGKFLAEKTLRKTFHGLNEMKNFLGIDETPLVLKIFSQDATKLSRELPTDIEIESTPLMECSSLAKHIQIKKREAS